MRKSTFYNNKVALFTINSIPEEGKKTVFALEWSPTFLAPQTSFLGRRVRGTGGRAQASFACCQVPNRPQTTVCGWGHWGPLPWSVCVDTHTTHTAMKKYTINEKY